MSAGRAVVIGGGVIGACSAHYLRAAGWDVTLIERGAFGRGCSHGNCGFVCPSHILPLAAPGAALKAFAALLKRNSPFYIKPRLDPSLWAWLLKFAARCNETDMLAAGHAIHALLQSSAALYPQLIQGEALDCEWQAKGLLLVYLTRSAMDEYAQTDRIMREHFDHPARRLAGDAIREMEPALKCGLAGGWHYPADAHLRPDKLMSGLRRALESKGVRIIENCDAAAFVREGNCARAVLTPQCEMPADAFVLATGAWAPRMNRELGCKLPIQPGKGYSITMPRPKVCPEIPLLFPEHKVGVTPMQSGYRLGSTMEFAGYDATLNPRRLALLREGAKPYLREPYCEPVTETWFGWRPMTFDSVPIIARAPALENVLIAAGHGMLGLSMAPGTGKLASELLSGAAPHIDPKPYALKRFR